MRLIDVDDLGVGRCSKDVLPAAYCAGWNGLLGLIEKAPTVDAVPVVHGRWDDSGRYTFPSGSTAVRCTNCGCALTESEYHLNNWNYCPVCGAKMDGERKDNENE